MRGRGVVAAGHEMTVESAAEILRAGGNAFDAILAAMCVACVTEPVLVSPGGGGFLLARAPGQRGRIYDFFVQTPGGKPVADEQEFREVQADFGTVRQSFHIGAGAIAVPGLVRGLFEIHRDLGSMPMREIVSQAVRLARGGVTVNGFQAYIFDIVETIFTATAGAREAFASPDEAGRLIGEGETLRLPRLADALEMLAIEGDDLFYRGEIGEELAALCLEHGGPLTREDLERYEVVRRDPLTLDYRDARVWTNPPPAAGGLLIAFGLAMLAPFERFDRTPFGSLEHLDLLARVMEATNEARVDREAIGADGSPQAGPLLDEVLLARYRDGVQRRARCYRGTTHFSVIDAEGRVASMTVSNGEGCGHVLAGAGFMPNNMLGEDDLFPSGFHSWQPDQRISSMMSPSIALWPDGHVVATGSGGSKRIRTAILQLLCNVIDHRMPLEEAVAAPRLFYEEELLSVEGGFDGEVVADLLESYPRHELWDELNLFFGGAHSVELGRDGFHGAGDPRRGGSHRVVV